MTSATALRLRHPLQRREPAAGFAARLAAVNGRPMNAFLRDMRIAPRRIDLGEPEKVIELAILGGADPAELARYTPAALDRKGFHALGKEIVGYRGVNRTFFRFCPHCVTEDLEKFPGPRRARPWLRLEWTIGHYRSCDVHRVYFTNTSPVRRRFEPFDFSETIETYLIDLARYCDTAVPAPPSPYQKWMTTRLDGRSDPDNWLDQFPFYVGAEWCEALGISSLHLPKVGTSKFTERDWAEAGDEGFAIASGDGAAGIRRLLSRLSDAQRDTRGFWGVHDTYGHAYKFLQRTAGDPAFEPVRELVRDHANATIPIEPGTDVLGVKISKPGIVTVRTAARQSGVHEKTIRRFFERTGIASEAIDGNLRNHRVTVSADDIKDVIGKLKGALSGPNVTKRFGIPRMHLDALVRVGALPTVTGSEREAYAKHRFAVDDVEIMLERLFSRAEEVTDPTDRQLSVMDCRHTACASLDALLGMIFSGDLAWKGRLADRSDYLSLLLDADEVIARVRSEPPMQHYRKSDVTGHVTGLSPLAVDPLISMGLLETGTEFSRDARREVQVILRPSVEAFSKRYVCLGELSISSGLHFKQIQSLLSAANMSPAFNPDQVKVWLYERQTIETLVAERPTFWAYTKGRA